MANAPPRDGLLELVPLSGEGLITPFAVNTFGWTDEAESGAMDGMDVFFGGGDDFTIFHHCHDKTVVPGP